MLGACHVGLLQIDTSCEVCLGLYQAIAGPEDRQTLYREFSPGFFDLIVLDREVSSMTEFKQIVGRGIRVHEDSRKYYFTLMDFRGATSHFANPKFDGEPVHIYEPGPDDPITPPDTAPASDPNDPDDAIPAEPGADEAQVLALRGKLNAILAEALMR